MLKYVKSFNCFGPCFEAPTREVNGLKALHVVCVLLSKGPAFHLLIEAKREHLQLHGGFASLVFMAESTNIHHHVEASQGQRNCCGRSTGQEGSYAPAALEGCVLHILTSKCMWRNAHQKGSQREESQSCTYVNSKPLGCPLPHPIPSWPNPNCLAVISLNAPK